MYVTILYRNKMHKIKTERGVEVTRKCDGQTDRQTGVFTISPTFFKSAGINKKKGYMVYNMTHKSLHAQYNIFN